MRYEATADTPEITLDDTCSRMVIKGLSLPEDPSMFYQPLIAWARDFSPALGHHLVVEFFREYFNSSSGIYLFEFLSTLERSAKGHVKVIWISEEKDELMLERGQEFSGFLTLPFEFCSAER